MVSASCASGTLPGVTLGVGAGGGFGASAAACSSSRSMSSCFFPLTFRPRSFRSCLSCGTFSVARSSAAAAAFRPRKLQRCSGARNADAWRMWSSAMRRAMRRCIVQTAWRGGQLELAHSLTSGRRKNRKMPTCGLCQPSQPSPKSKDGYLMRRLKSQHRVGTSPSAPPNCAEESSRRKQRSRGSQTKPKLAPETNSRAAARRNVAKQ